MDIAKKPFWNLSEVWSELESLARTSVRKSPLFLAGALLLLVTIYIGIFVAGVFRKVFEKRIPNRLIRNVAAKSVAVLIFLLGIYLVLRISGLTRLAVTVLGGTGLIGLVIGIAFRDIVENFLASILISVQRPFETGDLIEISDYIGFVQSVSTRSTLIMTLDGNHVQIPNSMVYKNTIMNFTANPLMRVDFKVGVGYDSSVTEAQKVGLEVMRKHPAVLDDPEPLVLVESLDDSVIMLKFYLWIDLRKHSWDKVKSAVIRLTLRGMQENGISLPDAQREIVFPNGVPVEMIGKGPSGPTVVRAVQEDVSETESEGDLESEDKEIRKQSRTSRNPEGSTNLLE